LLCSLRFLLFKKRSKYKRLRARATHSARAVDQPVKTYRLAKIVLPERNPIDAFFRHGARVAPLNPKMTADRPQIWYDDRCARLSIAMV
jgi:hypothetical protein